LGSEEERTGSEARTSTTSARGALPEREAQVHNPKEKGQEDGQRNELSPSAETDPEITLRELGLALERREKDEWKTCVVKSGTVRGRIDLVTEGPEMDRMLRELASVMEDMQKIRSPEGELHWSEDDYVLVLVNVLAHEPDAADGRGGSCGWCARHEDCVSSYSA
jgi:hypothetical protein